MAEGKRVAGLTPEQPTAEAARLVLMARLKAVQHFLPLAVEQPDDDVEHVHQLRVTTRRAAAALRIFRDFLPRKARRDARSVLRSIRRAAGEARDWDVFLGHLLESKPAQSGKLNATIEFLKAYTFGRRDSAQAILYGVAEERSAELEKLCESLPDDASGDDPPTLMKLGTAELAPLLDELTASIDANPTAPTQLHELRIAGKRLRYAMEVFATCFEAPFREKAYPTVERLQDVLGAIQDAHVGTTRLTALRDRLKKVDPVIASRVGPGLTRLIAAMQHRTVAGRREFRQWVKEWKGLVQAYPFEMLLRPVGDQSPLDRGATGSSKPVGGGSASRDRGNSSRGARGNTSGGSRSRVRA